MTPKPTTPTIEQLRQKADQFSEMARSAMSPEPKKVFEDLAEMYAEMARSVENLHALQAQMSEHH